MKYSNPYFYIVYFKYGYYNINGTTETSSPNFDCYEPFIGEMKDKIKGIYDNWDILSYYEQERIFDRRCKRLRFSTHNILYEDLKNKLITKVEGYNIYIDGDSCNIDPSEDDVNNNFAIANQINKSANIIQSYNNSIEGIDFNDCISYLRDIGHSSNNNNNSNSNRDLTDDEKNWRKSIYIYIYICI